MPASEQNKLLGFANVLRTDAQREEFSDFDEHAPPKPDPLATVRFKDKIQRTIDESSAKPNTGA